MGCSPLLDSERVLAYLLGLHAHWIAQGTATQPVEQEAGLSGWTVLLQGGLHITTPPSPYEEKSEARSSNGSTPTDPTTPPQPHVTSPGDCSVATDNMRLSVNISAVKVRTIA